MGEPLGYEEVYLRESSAGLFSIAGKRSLEAARTYLPYQFEAPSNLGSRFALRRSSRRGPCEKTHLDVRRNSRSTQYLSPDSENA